MNDLIIKILVLAAFTQLGININDFAKHSDPTEQRMLDRTWKQVLYINWKPKP